MDMVQTHFPPCNMIAVEAIMNGTDIGQATRRS